MAALVFVPPKNGSFSYCNTKICRFWLLSRRNATHIQKSKTTKTRRKQKNKKTIPLEETLGNNISPKTLVFLVSLVFWFFSSPCSRRKLPSLKTKKTRRKPKKQRNQKNKETEKPIPWRKPLGTTFLPRLCFLVSLVFLVFFRVFFFSPVADESLRV